MDQRAMGTCCKVFNQVTPEGKEPMPSPVKDAQGNTNEDMLKDNTPVEKVPDTLKKVYKKKRL